MPLARRQSIVVLADRQCGKIIFETAIIDILEKIASLEGIALNLVDRRGDRDRCQVVAAIESIILDQGNAFWDGDGL